MEIIPRDLLFTRVTADVTDFTLGPKGGDEKTFVSLAHGMLRVHINRDYKVPGAERPSLLHPAVFGVGEIIAAKDPIWYEGYLQGKNVVNAEGRLVHVSKYLFTMLYSLNQNLNQLGDDDPTRVALANQIVLINGVVETMASNRDRHPLFDIERAIFVHKSGGDMEAGEMQEIVGRCFGLYLTPKDRELLLDTVITRAESIGRVGCQAILNQLVVHDVDMGIITSTSLLDVIRMSGAVENEGLVMLTRLLEVDYKYKVKKDMLMRSIINTAGTMGSAGAEVLNRILAMGRLDPEVDSVLLLDSIAWAAAQIDRGSINGEGTKILYHMLDDGFDLGDDRSSVLFGIASAARSLKQNGIGILSRMLENQFDLGDIGAAVLGRIAEVANSIGDKGLEDLALQRKANYIQ